MTALIIKPKEYENFVGAESGTPLTDIFPGGIYFDEARGIIENCVVADFPKIEGIQTNDYPVLNAEVVDSSPIRLTDLLVAKNAVCINTFLNKELSNRILDNNT